MLSHNLNNEIVVFNVENLWLWYEEYSLLNVEDPDERDPNAALARESRKAVLVNNAREGIAFIGELRLFPAEKLYKFKHDTLKEIVSYNVRYPTNQNPLVRKASIQLYDRIAGNLNLAVSDHLALRKEYYDLCYLLWIILLEIENNKTSSNDQFAQVIIDLIKKSHIPMFGDLPNELKTRNAYFKLGDPTPEKLMDDATLYERERQRLENQRMVLEAKISAMESGDNATDLSKTQAILVKDILNEIGAQKNSLYFDRKFAITVLNYTQILLDAPENERHQQAYHALANHAEGKPTRFKALAGYMLRLLGCLTLMAALAVPLLCLTSTLLVTLPVYASVLLTIGLLKVGTSIIYHGDTYLENGVRHGLSLTMEKAVNQIEQPVIGMRP